MLRPPWLDSRGVLRRANKFIFIGPPEALDYALSIGIPKSNAVSFSADGAGITMIMARLSKSMKAYQLSDRRYALKLRN